MGIAGRLQQSLGAELSELENAVHTQRERDSSLGNEGGSWQHKVSMSLDSSKKGAFVHL